MKGFGFTLAFQIPDNVQGDIPEGTYKAQLASTEIRSDGKFGDGKFRVWHWLVDVAGELVEFSDSTSLGLGPRTNGYQRLTALLQRAPKAGETIEDPTGKTVMLTIGKKDSGWPRVDAVAPYVEPQMAAGVDIPR